MILLKISGLSKSAYYYTLAKIDKDDKNKEIIEKIKEIFINNKERYGYRRITLELKNQGYNVKHKKVYRLMVKLDLKPLKRNKRKYSSYKGTIGRIDLWIPYFFKEKDNKYISVSVNMLNKYADMDYILAFQEGIDATGGKNIENAYISKNLDSNVVVYTNDWSPERLTATFVYDDILYCFMGNNISKDEMISIIETLK